ncbi:hypothetical protein D5I55_08185 [Chakrabartia godavariana]|jgi:hypothetical protein|nr:hypothetical protein D5I55_08185 [Chakrabartia godavariana]
MANVGQSIAIGLKRRWQRASATFLSVLGSVWLVTEVLTRVSLYADQWLDAHGSAYLVVTVVAASIGFFVAAYEVRAVAFTIPNTDTTLTLKFGSIFDEDADWIIGVNEFFDSTLGDIVSVNTLHGQIIAKLYNGNEANFRRDVDAALADFQGQAVQRTEGQAIKYELGTTVVIPRGQRRIFLVAISKTDLATHRSSSTVPIVWDALAAAIKEVDSRGNGDPLALPLIGNGRAGLNIPPQHLLRIITLRLTELGKQFDLPRRVTVNLSDDCFEHLDLVEIKRGWSVV